jgi:hypothetical protein
MLLARAALPAKDPAATYDPKAFIGLHDFIEDDMEFYWDDQSQFRYHKWDSSEPDNYAEDMCNNASFMVHSIALRSSFFNEPSSNLWR